jgi:DNA repair photolyase
VQIKQVQNKSILTRTTGYLKNVCSHSLNPYSGCGFGKSSCGQGCYVRFNTWVTQGREWGSFVDVKANAADLYCKTINREKAWAHRQSMPFSIFMSSSTDPWQPAEKKYRISRKVLQAMRVTPPDEIILQTHSATLSEDIDLIDELSRSCKLRVHISIEGDRDSLPGLPPPPCSVDDRIRALEQLSLRGIFTVACLSPLYPLNDAELFFQRLKSAGTSAIIIDHFISGDGTSDGSRTHKTSLPDIMKNVAAESVHLSYRNKVIDIAKNYLPTGVSAAGFAGNYS